MSGRGKTKKKPQSSTAKAGLTLSVSRTRRWLKKGKYSKRTSSCAGVYLAAVLEYLASEVWEISGDATFDNKKKMITPRFMTLAIRNDHELNKLLAQVTIAQGGVLPGIHPELQMKRRSKLSKSQDSDN